MVTYVALSRPPSFAQLLSLGLPADLRDIIEGGPPEGILSRFAGMFDDIEEATRLRASELMVRLGWAPQTPWRGKPTSPATGQAPNALERSDQPGQRRHQDQNTVNGQYQ